MTTPLVYYGVSAVAILAAAAMFIMGNDGIAVAFLILGILIFGFAEYWNTK